jgi:alcohol dehydrogenase class IV
MDSFEYSPSPVRVVFGSGTVKKLPDELNRLNVSRPLFLSTPRQAAQIPSLGQVLLNASIQQAGLFSEATMHTPTHITDSAETYAQKVGADSIISFGGGSTVGLGKALSVRTGLPHICIVTTYSGSEMTSIVGETFEGKKTTRSDPKIFPAMVIYDVELTLELPAATSAVSGVNAMAHAGRLVSTSAVLLSIGSRLCHISRSTLRPEQESHYQHDGA